MGEGRDGGEERQREEKSTFLTGELVDPTLLHFCQVIFLAIRRGNKKKEKTRKRR
jgi:hypothetical protein